MTNLVLYNREIYYLSIMHICLVVRGGVAAYLNHLSSVTSFPLAQSVRPVEYVQSVALDGNIYKVVFNCVYL